MFKEADIMFIYTETSLHAGSGTSLEVIDLPIQREKHTNYPMLQASGVKGAVRDWFENEDGKDQEKVNLVFGPDRADELGGEGEAFAGALTFTDSRLLLFPVRSFKGVFAYTTSPFVLNRLKRDLLIAGREDIPWNLSEEPGESQVLGVEESGLEEEGTVILDEYSFAFSSNDEVKKIAEWISENAFPKGKEYNFWREKVKKDLVVLPDNAFKDLVTLSTEVQARIRLNNDTKTVETGALFYEESLMPDTLLYSIAMAQDPYRGKEDVKDARAVLDFVRRLDGKRTQFGGDTTIGKGIVSVRFLKGGSK